MAVKSKATILSEIATNIDDNTSGNVTPADVRTRLEDMTDSMFPYVDNRSGEAVLFDDFIYSGTPSFLWTNSANGASSAVTWITGQVSGHWGNVTMATGTATTGRSAINGSQTDTNGDAIVTVEALIQVPSSLSDGTDSYAVLVGIGNNETLVAQANGVYFLYDSVANGANWHCVTAASSTRTTTDSAVAAVANAWVKLRFEVNAASSSVAFYIDGTLVATNTTNIPTGTGGGMRRVIGIFKSAGANSRTLQADWYLMRKQFTTAR